MPIRAYLLLLSLCLLAKHFNADGTALDSVLEAFENLKTSETAADSVWLPDIFSHFHVENEKTARVTFSNIILRNLYDGTATGENEGIIMLRETTLTVSSNFVISSKFDPILNARGTFEGKHFTITCKVETRKKAKGHLITLTGLMIHTISNTKLTLQLVEPKNRLEKAFMSLFGTPSVTKEGFNEELFEAMKPELEKRIQDVFNSLSLKQ